LIPRGYPYAPLLFVAAPLFRNHRSPGRSAARSRTPRACRGRR
jgi:hypothetical protein